MHLDDDDDDDDEDDDIDDPFDDDDDGRILYGFFRRISSFTFNDNNSRTANIINH